jgi:hypothetical protein
MTPAIIAQLLAEFGLPLVQQLAVLYRTGKDTEVSQAQFDALMVLASYRSTDALAAAGIKIVDGVVVKT